MTHEGWVNLKDYVDHRIADLVRLLETNHAAVEAEIDRRVENLRREALAAQAVAAGAVDKAEKVIDRRLEAMNEFRHQLERQGATFVTQDEATRGLDMLEGRLSSIERWQATVAGRTAGLVIVWSLFVAVVTGLTVHVLS